jgi:hypothetical protein
MTSWFRIGLLVALIHSLEDVALLSLGRFLPVPVWLMYVIGVGLSATVLTLLIGRITRRVSG